METPEALLPTQEAKYRRGTTFVERARALHEGVPLVKRAHPIGGHPEHEGELHHLNNKLIGGEEGALYYIDQNGHALEKAPSLSEFSRIPQGIKNLGFPADVAAVEFHSGELILYRLNS